MERLATNFPSTTLGMEGEPGMSETHRIEVEFEDHCYQALLREAERLSVGVEQVIERAVAAWVVDISENLSACTPTANVVS